MEYCIETFCLTIPSVLLGLFLSLILLITYSNNRIIIVEKEQK